MSNLDTRDRVYPAGHENDPDYEAPCMWFALCENPANGLWHGPIGGGQFGDVPICARCDAKLEAMK